MSGVEQAGEIARVPYFADDTVTLHHGDALDVLRDLPDQSVNCCVTSPPYFGLRNYGEEGQYGLEASPAEYVEVLRTLFAEVRRVLADDGTLWLNLGDSYSGSWGGQGVTPKTAGKHGPVIASGQYATRSGARAPGAPPAKNLFGIPWRVAFALQDDGWTLRNDIIWAKANCMPEAVRDRLSSKHEHLFLFSKSRRYWFDLTPIREPISEATVKRSQPHRAAPGRSSREGLAAAGIGNAQTLDIRRISHPDGKNPGDVWTLPTQPFSEAHFAVMPSALAERAIQAGCKPGGVVLDPFSGSGTTGLAAHRHGRRYVGIDLSADYLDLSLRTRFAQRGLDLVPLTSPGASA